MADSRDSYLRGYHSAGPLPSLELNDLYFIRKESAASKSENSASRLHICLICLEKGAQLHLSDSCANTYGVSTFGDSLVVRGVCLSCIDLYLISSINSARIDATGAIRCHCPDTKCSFRYNREFILSRVASEETRRRYEHFALNSLVEADETLRWCPRQGCGSIVTITSKKQKRIKCSQCLGSFCSQCGNEHSSWTPCSLVTPPPPLAPCPALPGLTCDRELKMISCNGRALRTMAVAGAPLAECILKKMAAVAMSPALIVIMSSVGTVRRHGPTTSALRVMCPAGSDGSGSIAIGAGICFAEVLRRLCRCR
jgi:hypothetical protein